MRLSDIAKHLDLTTLCGNDLDEIEVGGGYAGDLLSDVLANAESGSLWFTIQRHKNIIAVATAKDVAGIVIVNGIKAEDSLIETAEKMGVPVFSAKEDAFVCSGRLYAFLNT